MSANANEINGAAPQSESPSPSAESAEKTSSEAAEITGTPPPACAPGVDAMAASPDHNGAAGSAESPIPPTHTDPAAPSPPPGEQLVEALPEAPKLLILPGERADPRPRNGTKAATSTKAPVFERDSPALVECRDALRSLVEFLEAEIKDARLAKDNTAQKLMPRSLENFIQALASNLRDAKVLYAAAYANTLGDRYDSIQPRIVHARTLAARAGLKLPAARG